MLNMEAMLLEAANSTFFGKADLVHGYLQITLNADGAHIHPFRGADARSLYEPIRVLQGFKDSGIYLQLNTTELFDKI